MSKREVGNFTINICFGNNQSIVMQKMLHHRWRWWCISVSQVCVLGDVSTHGRKAEYSQLLPSVFCSVQIDKMMSKLISDSEMNE